MLIYKRLCSITVWFWISSRYFWENWTRIRNLFFQNRYFVFYTFQNMCTIKILTVQPIALSNIECLNFSCFFTWTLLLTRKLGKSFKSSFVLFLGFISQKSEILFRGYQLSITEINHKNITDFTRKKIIDHSKCKPWLNIL